MKSKHTKTRKKIAIIGFGGTIAMVPNKEGVLVSAKTVDDLAREVPSLKNLAETSMLQLENLDSTNINPNHWVKLIKALAEAHERYDGIIITHGTDTMAYSAGAVSLALGKEIKIPIVFTGSQLPIIEPGTDARFNLENAMKTVLTASDENIAEVMVVFSDRVLRGARTIKTSEAKFDAFDSPALPHLAQITAAGVSFGPLARRVTNSQKLIRKIKPLAKFQKGILTIDLVPGLEPKILKTILETGQITGLLMKSLGAGNVPSEGAYSLLPIIKQAIKIQKIPVLISTKFVGGTTIMDIYETGKKAMDMGAIPTNDMTDVMAQVKLMWLLGQSKKSHSQLRKEILTNYVGEISV